MPTVVLFKSESQGPDKFVELLNGHNFDVESINCLSFQFTNLKTLKEKLCKPSDYEGIIFTSPRSVKAIQMAIDDKLDMLEPWKKKKNYSVGESTSSSAVETLSMQTDGKQSGNAQNLAADIISAYKDHQSSLKPFLFPSGNLKQDILEKSLNEHQIVLESLEVYETIQHPKLEESIRSLKTRTIDFYVFFSPSGIKFSFPLLAKQEVDLKNKKLVAIGPSTKKCLEENGFECFRMCTKPSPESLLEALSQR